MNNLDDFDNWPAEIEQPQPIATKAEDGTSLIYDLSGIVEHSAKLASGVIEQLGITDSPTKCQLFESILYFLDPARLYRPNQIQSCDCPDCAPPGGAAK